MRVLLDENLPQRLAQEFDKDHDARTVGQCGWKGKENGELLGLAEAKFDVFLTTDQGIPHQQNLTQIELGIVLLRAQGNRWADLVPLMESVNQRIREIEEGDLIEVAR